MKNASLDRIEKLLFAVMGILLVLVLILSSMAQNVVHKSRENGGYRLVENAAFQQIAKEDAPTGLVNEYRFWLGQIGHADMLAFYINHHNIEVYFEDQCVYAVAENGNTFRTAGGVWTLIPLYERDAGAEVRVMLSPLYDNYQDEQPEFLIGSELAIVQRAFFSALPELVMSLCVALAGVFLLCLAIYHSVKRDAPLQIYAIALLALFAGLWRFTYGSFSYLILGEYSVFLFTLSVISLMVIALSMLNCADLDGNKKAAKLIKYGSIAYSLVYILQLAIQLTGVLDLRQMLQVTHITIIISAAVLCIGSVTAWRQKRMAHNYLWILGVGVMIDLLLYYFAETSAGMLFTLSAILCFSMLEGVKLLIDYTQQKTALEEMQTKLIMSRTTTMMSQIRSHFVFNLLNAVSGMCKYDPEKADDTIVRFARYLRSNIDIMENDTNIPFATDLRQLEDYVMLEQVRFGDKIEFYTDIEVDRFMIPPLILQPVVENAIKHGISKKLTNGTIILRTRDVGDHIVITVEDDGVGFPMEALENEKSVGLRNIRFRLQHLVGGQLDIQSQVGVGTTVTITIPKER